LEVIAGGKRISLLLEKLELWSKFSLSFFSLSNLYEQDVSLSLCGHRKWRRVRGHKEEGRGKDRDLFKVASVLTSSIL